jgi:1-acyl-sn-glycerol-3-phosphate acyltransferase
MFRSFWLNTFIAIYTVGYCLLAILLSLFDRTGRTVRDYVSIPWSKGILWACGIKVRAKGQENIQDGIPLIFMCNHQSYFDIFVLLSYMPADFKFIMKQELMKIPLFGLAMKGAGYLGIERENPREAKRSMDELAQNIRSGSSVLIFPEGTRSPDGELLPFKKGGFHMALKAGCDIVPVAISNTYRIVEKGRLRINKGSVDIQFGKPIPVKDYGKKDLPDLMERVKEAISNQMMKAPINNHENIILR